MTKSWVRLGSRLSERGMRHRSSGHELYIRLDDAGVTSVNSLYLKIGGLEVRFLKLGVKINVFVRAVETSCLKLVCYRVT